MPKFEFQPEGHKYLIDNQEWLSVTQVLPKSPYMKNNEEARVKGNYVHELCRLYLLNDLLEENLDSALVPYLQALKKFLSDSKGMGLTSCIIDLKSGAKSPTVELQIAAYIELVNNGVPKNSLSHEYPCTWLEEPFMHPLYQYAGTPDIVFAESLPIREGHALYLKDNGKYKLETIPNVRRNFEHFLCKLDSFKWDKEKGLI